MNKETEHRQMWEVQAGIGHLPRQLDSLNKIYLQLSYEKDNESLYSLYHLYVYVLCSFCESLLRTTYNEVLKEGWNYIQNSKHRRLIEQTEKKLEFLSWSELVKEDITYLGSEIPDKLKISESYKALSILFKLRNKLIHGSSFERSYIVDIGSDNSRYEITGSAYEVYKFLLEKGLLKKEEISKLGHYELNSDIIMYFLSQVISFSKSYATFLTEISNDDYSDCFTGIGLFDEKIKIFKK